VSTKNFQKFNLSVQKNPSQKFEFVQFFIYRKIYGGSVKGNFTITGTQGLFL